MFGFKSKKRKENKITINLTDEEREALVSEVLEDTIWFCRHLQFNDFILNDWQRGYNEALKDIKCHAEFSKKEGRFL